MPLQETDQLDTDSPATKRRKLTSQSSSEAGIHDLIEDEEVFLIKEQEASECLKKIGYSDDVAVRIERYFKDPYRYKYYNIQSIGNFIFISTNLRDLGFSEDQLNTLAISGSEQVLSHNNLKLFHLLNLYAEELVSTLNGFTCDQLMSAINCLSGSNAKKLQVLADNTIMVGSKSLFKDLTFSAVDVVLLMQDASPRLTTKKINFLKENVDTLKKYFRAIFQ